MDFVFDPSLVLYLPLYQLDGASFVSKDAHGHLCSVTGALWRPNGYYFDGTDDKITVPDHPSLNMGTGDFTLLAWIKTSTDVKPIFNKGQEGTGGKRYQLYTGIGATAKKLYISFDDNTTHSTGSANSVISDGTWHLGGASFDRSGDATFFLDGDADGTLDISGTYRTVDDVNDLLIGSKTTSPSYFNGDLGEIWVYNRVLTPQEIQYNYLATKWRYR